ncbi:uncharacterized protein [Narcine bancroftii]|uniref:uncharacterized protein n=1 Tax=Narcine bancroftii TaxID=1343680 RepID=UPI003831D20E
MVMDGRGMEGYGLSGWDCTLFLLAGYAKYRRPYVWLRSHPRQQLRSTAGLSTPSDCPLKLVSTQDPPQGAGLIWEIIAELVNLCTHPPPPNPFSLDLRHFECLPLTERFLASGATISFLQKLLIDGDREKPYYSKVVEELWTLTRLHVRALLEVQKLKLREREEEEQREREDDSSLSSNE